MTLHGVCNYDPGTPSRPRTVTVRFRLLALVALLALLAAACGNDDSTDPAEPQDDSTTSSVDAEEPRTDDHHMDDMDHSDPGHDMEDMDHDGEAVRPATPLPVLPDGTLDPEGVDLSGVDGVTPEQQAYAEALLVDAIEQLPTWANYDDAIADGFKSIGDGLTGEEHVIHWDWIEDDVWLDPSKPESLVYKVDNAKGTKTLEAAMFLLPSRFTLANAPTDAGALWQFHIHDDLCFTAGDTPRVAGLRGHGGECTPPLVAFNPNIMVHVWIRPNPCGPFAALRGIGGGQIEPGDEVTCLHEHGSPSL
jgi:hypothetical protein